MANNIAITRSIVDGTVFTAAQNNTQCTDIETFINTTKLTGDNIQAGAITVTELGTGAVTSAKILAGAVGTAALASSAVTTAIIADSNVTTAKIADGNVTQAKRVALGQQVSSSCGNFSTTSTSAVNVTNLSVTITTTGRPVYLGLISDGSGNGNPAYVNVTNTGSSNCSTTVGFHNGSAFVGSIGLIANSGTLGSTSIASTPATSFHHIDTPSASTITYTVKMLTSSGSTTATMNFAKLIAYEL